MTATSRWTSVALLPLIALFEALSWYAVRSVLPLHLRDLGAEAADIGTCVALSAFVGIAGTVLAGLVALAARPWGVLAAGLLLATLGLLGLLVADLGSVPPALGLASFGHGVVRAALWGAAARALGDEREHLRTAVFLLLYGTVSLAGLLSGLVGGLAADGSFGAVLSLAVGGEASALLLSIVLSVVLLVSRARREELAPPPAARAVHLVAVFLLALVLGGAWGSVNEASDLLFVTASALFAQDPSAMATVLSISGVTVVVLAPLLAGLFVVLHFTRARLPALLPAGVGLALAALGASIVLLQDPDAPSAPLLLVAMVVVAAGEVLAVPLVLSRIAGALPHRLETLVASVWIVASQAPGLLQRATGSPETLGRVLGWSGVVLGLLLGVALAAAAFPLRRVFDRPAQAPARAASPARQSAFPGPG